MPIHSGVLNRVSGALPVPPFSEALPGPFAQHAGLDWRDLGVPLAWGAPGGNRRCPRVRWNPERDHGATAATPSAVIYWTDGS
jgi:ABC-2 type transport system permease protein